MQQAGWLDSMVEDRTGRDLLVAIVASQVRIGRIVDQGLLQALVEGLV